MSDGVMTYEDWLRGCVYHDGRHGYVTLPCDEVLKIADFIESLRADRKTENSSEKPNNCEGEPQKIYCPKCGSSDYIKDLEKDFGVKDDTFKYKCINCNTYIKDGPQTKRSE